MKITIVEMEMFTAKIYMSKRIYYPYNGAVTNIDAIFTAQHNYCKVLSRESI